ncbi:MAG: FecR domain-containing protein [Legionellales bacterium]|nr:FecR domain-containing protein [Legionellales bacterium]
MNKSIIALPVFLLMTASPVFAAASVGKVIFAKGQVTIISAQQPMKAQRGSALHTGQSIQTGVNSTAQIRYSDNTLISIAPNSIYKIDQYRFNQNAKTDVRKTTLVQGGLRAITGKISKENPNAVTLQTKAATIGVRGTIYAVIINNNTTYAEATQGTLSVGNLLIGPTHPTRALKVNPGEPPQALPTIPEAIKNKLNVDMDVLSNVPQGGSSSGGTSSSPSSESISSSDESNLAANDLTSQNGDIDRFTNPVNMVNNPRQVVSNFNVRPEYFAAGDFGRTGIGATEYRNTVGYIEANRITNPIIYDNVLGDISGTLNASATQILPGVYYGEWDSTYCELCNPSTFGSAAFPTTWISAQATPLQNLPTTGVINYSTPVFISATTDSASNDVAGGAWGGSFNLNFTTGEFAGNMNLTETISGTTWNANIDGVLVNGTVRGFNIGGMNTAGGTIDTGEFSGFLSGSNSDYLINTFRFNANNTGASIGGVSVIGR